MGTLSLHFTNRYALDLLSQVAALRLQSPRNLSVMKKWGLIHLPVKIQLKVLSGTAFTELMGLVMFILKRFLQSLFNLVHLKSSCSSPFQSGKN